MLPSQGRGPNIWTSFKPVRTCDIDLHPALPTCSKEGVPEWLAVPFALLVRLCQGELHSFLHVLGVDLSEELTSVQ